MPINELTRIKSAEAAKLYQRTSRVAGPASTTEARIDDRCAVISDGVSHEGTIKFIGYLKGHCELFAGVDFYPLRDEEIGDGTGVYRGEILFHAAKNHARFVPISELYISHLPSAGRIAVDNDNSVVQTQISRESRKVAPPPVPPPPVVKSFNHHSKLTPPPVPPPPVMKMAESRSKMSPPPVPPPPVHVEDYMINPFTIGDRVQVYHLGACRSGVLVWMGDAISSNYDHIETSAIVVLDDPAPPGWRLLNKSLKSSAGELAKEVLMPIAALRRDRRRHRSSSDSKNPLKREWSPSTRSPKNQNSCSFDDKLLTTVANMVQTQLDRTRESFEEKTAALLSELNNRAERLTRLEEELIKAQMSEIETRARLAASDERIKQLEKQLAAEKTTFGNREQAHLQVDAGKQVDSPPKSNIIEANVPGKEKKPESFGQAYNGALPSNLESYMRDEDDIQVEEWTHF
ncbi:unnamed protein product [Cylicocyclus nassatus]|uniref:CAP-Gly domain-containing protein n=1 Tax=Cylicocyclus nassatus TaxID=53992 RepID=A0AA36GSG5_CYLNA|nr:unnamed protein product [Cylicocyclus nassatus]